MAAMFSSTRQEFSGIGVLCYLYVPINILVQCMYLSKSDYVFFPVQNALEKKNKSKKTKKKLIFAGKISSAFFEGGDMLSSSRQPGK